LEILQADLVLFKEAQGLPTRRIDPMLKSITKLGGLNCIKQITKSSAENIPADENTNEHITQSYGSSSFSAPSDTNLVKIKKISGNFMNENVPKTAVYKPKRKE
ncbi:hypothetical protein EDC94DRAFT_500009, partial [Helicostylum pulchrum]